MGFEPKSPTPVYEDKTACFVWTNNVIGGQERAKHIDIRKHFAHEAAQLGHLRLSRVSTANRLADAFTKSLQPKQHAACVARLLSRTRKGHPHEGKRDSQRKQPESTSTLARGVSQSREFKDRV